MELFTLVLIKEQYKVVGQWSGPNLGSNESSEKPSHLIGHGSLLR
jgi:hypothetical protein